MKQNSETTSQYKVGTLNFSSTVVSPYEYHEHDVGNETLFEFQLNNIFKELAMKEYPDFSTLQFDWGICGIDLIWKNRFSPFYLLNCGVKQNGKMMNESEFLAQWQIQTGKIKEKIIRDGVQRKKSQSSAVSREQIQSNLMKQISLCKNYDLLGYKAFIKYFYKTQDLPNLDVSAQKYLTQRKVHFSKGYLNFEAKQNKFVQMIRSQGYDIFCLQQCSLEFVSFLKSALKEYIIVEMPDIPSRVCESIILLNGAKFPGYNLNKIIVEREEFLKQFCARIKQPQRFSSKLPSQTIKLLNQNMQEQGQKHNESQLIQKLQRELFWNSDSCYCVVGPLIIFSPHISSKKIVNKEQVIQIKKTLLKIRTYFPDSFFICAGDLNGEFDSHLNLNTNDKKNIKVNVFPTHQQDVTCKKMRTLTQSQKNKAFQLNLCKKDFIITDLKIAQPSVLLCNGMQVSKQNAPFLPNCSHPFDHFVVAAMVQNIGKVSSGSLLLKREENSRPFDGLNRANLDHQHY